MSDIRLVLYKDNRTPKSIALSTRIIYRTMFFAMLVALLLILSTGAAVRFYLAARSNLSSNRPVNSPEQSESENGPSNSLEAQNKYMRDQVDQLNSRLQ